jgi:hypothetical protein
MRRKFLGLRICAVATLMLGLGVSVGVAEPAANDIAARTELHAIQTLTLSDKQFLIGDAEAKATVPSPNGRRVGIRIVTFEACSGFTQVTARRIAQPPKAAFVTRLQPCRLPGRAARQLPDQSTTLWVESSSTSDPRLRGALPSADITATARLRLP